MAALLFRIFTIIYCLEPCFWAMTEEQGETQGLNRMYINRTTFQIMRRVNQGYQTLMRPDINMGPWWSNHIWKAPSTGVDVRTQDAFRSNHSDHIRTWSGPHVAALFRQHWCKSDRPTLEALKIKVCPLRKVHKPCPQIFNRGLAPLRSYSSHPRATGLIVNKRWRSRSADNGEWNASVVTQHLLTNSDYKSDTVYKQCPWICKPLVLIKPGLFFVSW